LYKHKQCAKNESSVIQIKKDYRLQLHLTKWPFYHWCKITPLQLSRGAQMERGCFKTMYQGTDSRARL